VLDLQLYAGLTLTDAVGTVYSIEYVTDLAQTNNVSAWRGLEFLHLHQFRSSSGHHRSACNVRCCFRLIMEAAARVGAGKGLQSVIECLRGAGIWQDRARNT